MKQRLIDVLKICAEKFVPCQRDINGLPRELRLRVNLKDRTEFLNF